MGSVSNAKVEENIDVERRADGESCQRTRWEVVGGDEGNEGVDWMNSLLITSTLAVARHRTARNPSLVVAAGFAR